MPVLSAVGRYARACLTLTSLGFLLLSMSCHDGGPAGPDPENLEILMVQGNGQGAEPGTRLPLPLKVRIQVRGSAAPVEGARIRWELMEGLGGALEPMESRTDSMGLAATELTLGPSLGIYRVRAGLRGADAPGVEFSAEGLRAPTLSTDPLPSTVPGGTISLAGTHFSPTPEANVVTFSGVRARVLASSTEDLQVEVPPCLLSRDYQVKVQVGSLSTGERTVSVGGDPTALEMEPGEDRLLDSSRGLDCAYLPHRPGSSYLVVPHSTGTMDGAGYVFGLGVLTGDGVSPPSLPGAHRQSPMRLPGQEPGFPGGKDRAPGERSVSPAGGGQILPGGFLLEGILEAQDRWDERLREMESEMLAARAVGAPATVETPRAFIASPTVPEVGEKRSFKVLNLENRFDKVTAVVRYVSDHAILYEDLDVPGGGFTPQDLADLAAEFEHPIHSVVVDAFGSESDLDGNDRVIILFTTAVNRLTKPGSSGFIGGFFYGLDLLPEREGSNAGEIFYSIVPDPAGEAGPAISRFTALSAIPAILAHEFEHMVHFNQRMLLGGAASQEALWLSEALAQMAEDLVGTAFELARNPTKAQEYRSGNWIRARQFLQNPSRVSVVSSLPPGTLAERGAAWLLLKQVVGREGQDGLLPELTSSTRSGVDNLTAATGISWRQLVAEWVASLFLDGTNLPVRPELLVSGVNLRVALAGGDGSYPLIPKAFGGSSAMYQGYLWPSAPDFFIITPPPGGLTLWAGGGGLSALPEEPLGLRTLVVRLQ